MMLKISFAANFEDVYLSRAFADVTAGVYIDVGPKDPDLGCASRFFAERGWRGACVGVGAAYERFRTARPRDLILQNSLMTGMAEPRSVAGAVLRAAGAQEFGAKVSLAPVGENAPPRLGRGASKAWAVEDRPGQVTLTSVLEALSGESPVRFLKLDCDGAEAGVVRTVDWAKHRPEVIVCAATRPFSPTRIDAGIVDHFKNHQYKEVFFDGANAYFLREESAFRAHAFALPVNAADGFCFATPGLAQLLAHASEAGMISEAALKRVREVEAARLVRMRALPPSGSGGEAVSGLEPGGGGLEAAWRAAECDADQLARFVQGLAFQLLEERRFAQTSLVAAIAAHDRALSSLHESGSQTLNAAQTAERAAIAEARDAQAQIVALEQELMQTQQLLAEQAVALTAAQPQSALGQSAPSALEQAEHNRLLFDLMQARRNHTIVEAQHGLLIQQFEALATERQDLYGNLTLNRGPRAIRAVLPIARIIRMLSRFVGLSKQGAQFRAAPEAIPAPKGAALSAKGIVLSMIKSVFLPAGLWVARRFPNLTRALWVEVRARAPDLTSDGIISNDARNVSYVRRVANPAIPLNTDPDLARRLEAALLSIALHEEMQGGKTTDGQQ